MRMRLLNVGQKLANDLNKKIEILIPDQFGVWRFESFFPIPDYAD